jgi:sugar-specific transcriptional regulator TrmB
MNILEKNEAGIVVTGSTWMGSGIRSVVSIIEEMLTNAKDEITIVAYSITQGALNFLKKIQNCLNRGIRVTIIVNRFSDQLEEIRVSLMQMKKQFLKFIRFQSER